MKGKNKSIQGTCVSPGSVVGYICYYQPKIKYSKKDIVILDTWVTSGVALLKNVGGLISSQGGLTCHASIIAREYNIPCLVGVKNIHLLKKNAKVLLNATGEKISLL